VERTVKEVVPALVNNRDKMDKLIQTLNNQVYCGFTTGTYYIEKSIKKNS
jgi:hypothetical protein